MLENHMKWLLNFKAVFSKYEYNVFTVQVLSKS